MRKLIILAASIAALAIPAAAIANVAVDPNGTGFVGKGDVQTALGGINDNLLQTKWTAGGIIFTVGAEKVLVDYPMTCFDLNGGGVLSGVTGHRLIVQPGTAPVEAIANTNGAGKLTNGWNLTGKTTGFDKVGNSVLRETGCPAGSVLFMNTGMPAQPLTVSITGGLKVNGIDLPNTPEPVLAPVA